MNFEGLMALTNLASIDEDHRRKICDTKEMIPAIESCALEEHYMVRRAAVQLICNLCACEKYQNLFKLIDGQQSTCDRLKMLVLMCQEDDNETRAAAAGALATLTNFSSEIAVLVRNSCQSWKECLELAAFDHLADVRHRGLVLVLNLSHHCPETASELVNSQMKEIVIGQHKNLPTAWPVEDEENEITEFSSEQKKMLSSIAKDIVDVWVSHKLIEPNNI